MSLDYGVVNPGRLRNRVVLEELATPRTKNGYGELSSTWSTVGTYWADVRPLSGRELANAQQVKAEIDHMITMRWTGAEFTPDESMRFTWNGKVYNIVAILNADSRNRRLDILCQEQDMPVGT